ncbi:hypothetical protein FJY63_05360, partial [Candidatus Sumerlaeota bacterium]|nr:hypothetical protein [Candidatus Sumerlaeota bacterium]
AVALTTGSVRIADWSDGEPLVAHKSANGARLVGLNFFGPSSDTAGGTGLWDSATDGARLIANALVWASRALESDACATPCLVAEPAFTRGTTNTIAWEPFTVAEQVEIEWSQDGFASVVGRSGWIAESLRRWTVSGLANGRAYSYRMRGRSGPLSLSPYSNVVSSTQDASPPYSYVLALPPYRPATFSVSWTGSDELSGLASVRLFYRRGSTGPFVAYGGEHTKTPILFDATETGGSGDYYFYTIATDAVGNQESAPSGWDAHTTVQTEPPASPQLASEPLFTSGTTNRLSWNAVGEAAEYSLQWSEDSQFKSLAGSSGWTTTTVFAAAGLLDGHKYYYRIKSRNRALLESAWSASVSSTQDASPPQTSIGALPTTTSAAAIALSVSGSDVGSGLRSADLLWRRGSAGSFKQVAQFSTLPQEYSFYPAEHEGAGAHEFMVRGADKVGNTESKSLPDARTQVIWTGAAARSWEEYDR